MTRIVGQPGGGGGAVESVTGTLPIVVDNTDPANPIVTLPGTPFVVSDHTDQFTAGAAQTVFVLSVAPTFPNAVLMFVNGVEYRRGVDFTVVGTTLTWTNATFVMLAGFTVDVNYVV